MNSGYRPAVDLELVARALADGVALGRHPSPRLGRGIEFAGHRAYSRGDDARLIDWRAYARTDRLLIRDGEVDADHTWWIVIDTTQSMDLPCQLRAGARLTKLEAASQIAAALAVIAQRQGDRFALITWGRRWHVAVEPGRGALWLQRVLGKLATLAPEEGPYGPGRRQIALGMDQSSDVLVLTDGYDHDGDIVDALARLQHPRRQLRLLCVESRNETQPPRHARWMIEDLESGQLRAVDRAMWDRAASRREAYLGRLRRSLNAREIALDRLQLDADWTDQLRQLLGPVERAAAGEYSG